NEQTLSDIRDILYDVDLVIQRWCDRVQQCRVVSLDDRAHGGSPNSLDSFERFVCRPAERREPNAGLDPIRHGILIFEFVHRRLEVMAILVGVGATRGWRSTVLDAARPRS